MARAVHPVHRARRVHRVHAGDDGPVRSRRMARHAARPSRSGSGCSVGSRTWRWSTRTAGSVAGPSGAACSSRAGRAADVTLVALGVSSIIFDGLSQTAALLRPVRGARASRCGRCCCSRLLGHRRRCWPSPSPDGRARRDRRGAAADRTGLPHRPLPDLPADRRPADPHRHLRPVPEGLGPVRDGIPHADRRWLPPGLVWTVAARRGRRRPHARSVGRPRRRGRPTPRPGSTPAASGVGRSRSRS